MKIIKNIFALILCILIFPLAQAQQKMYAHYDNFNAQTALTKFQYLSNYLPQNTAITQFPIDPIAISSANYIYSIEDAGSNTHKLVSYNINATYSKNTIFSTLNWDGGLQSDARTRGIATTQNNQLWVCAFSVVSGINYLNSFNIDNNGNATVLNNKPFVVKTNLSSYEITDIAFDYYNNMYALVIDIANNLSYIYFIHQTDIANASNGATLTLEKKFQLFNNTGNLKMGSVYGNWGNAAQTNVDFYISEGLAFSHTGTLLVSADNIKKVNSSSAFLPQFSNFIFEYQFDDDKTTPLFTEHKLFESAVGSGALSICTDVGTNDYPIFLPTSIKNFSATLTKGSLAINWNTSSENNLSEFDILISNDGNQFFKLENIISKNTNGNSNHTTQYNFKKNITEHDFSISIFLLPFLVLSIIKRNKFTISIAIFIFVAFISCSKKSTQEEDKKYEGKLFVQLIVKNKNGKSAESKIISASSL